MGVEVSSNAYPRMSQPLTDHLEMHSSSQHQTGVGMTQVMEPHTIQTRFLCSVPKRLCHSIWMYRLSIMTAEDQIILSTGSGQDRRVRFLGLP